MFTLHKKINKPPSYIKAVKVRDGYLLEIVHTVLVENKEELLDVARMCDVKEKDLFYS